MYFKEEFFKLYKIMRLRCRPQKPGRGRPWICFYRTPELPPVAQDKTDSAERGNYETTVCLKNA